MINDHELNLLNQTFDSIYNRAYESGYEVGQKKREKDNQNYKDGLEDGKMLIWQFIGKLGKLTIGELYEIFGDGYDNIYAITDDYDASEFIDVIKRYEEQKNEIHVGDEVVSDSFDEKGIVTHITDKNCVSLICGMSSMINTSLDKIHKTGKSYPQIVEILEQLKGDKE